MAKLPAGWIFIPKMKDAVTITVEKRELVVCKDCTMRNEINCPQYYRRTELPDDYFCADGERRDGDG